MLTPNFVGVGMVPQKLSLRRTCVECCAWALDDNDGASVAPAARNESNSIVEAPACVAPRAQEGAQAAEDGTLEPWINRRRGGTALESSTNIRCGEISDVTIL